MALLPRLEKELAELKAGYTVEVIEEPGQVCVVIKGFGVGPGYNCTATDLLVRVPRTYPDAPLDMFWVDEALLLSNGKIPQAADAIETHIGRRWRRFSWHWPPPWNPNVGNLSLFIAFVRRRLDEKR